MQKAVFFIWIILTMSSVFIPEVYTISLSKQEKKEIQNDQDDASEKPDQKQLLLQIDRTILSPVQIGFHPGLTFVFEISFVLKNCFQKLAPGLIEISDYFKTLFHFIISPNAP